MISAQLFKNMRVIVAASDKSLIQCLQKYNTKHIHTTLLNEDAPQFINSILENQTDDEALCIFFEHNHRSTRAENDFYNILENQIEKKKNIICFYPFGAMVPALIRFIHTIQNQLITLEEQFTIIIEQDIHYINEFSSGLVVHLNRARNEYKEDIFVSESDVMKNKYYGFDLCVIKKNTYTLKSMIHEYRNILFIRTTHFEHLNQKHENITKEELSQITDSNIIDVLHIDPLDLNTIVFFLEVLANPEKKILKSLA